MTVGTTSEGITEKCGKSIGAVVAQYAGKIAHGIQDLAYDTRASVINALPHVGIVYALPSYIRVLKEKGFRGHNIIEPRTYFGDGLSFLTSRAVNIATLVGTPIAFYNFPIETAVAIGLGNGLSYIGELRRRSTHENMAIEDIR